MQAKCKGLRVSTVNEFLNDCLQEGKKLFMETISITVGNNVIKDIRYILDFISIMNFLSVEEREYSAENRLEVGIHIAALIVVVGLLEQILQSSNKKAGYDWVIIKMVKRELNKGFHIVGIVEYQLRDKF
jgi:hypothetical protein